MSSVPPPNPYASPIAPPTEAPVAPIGSYPTRLDCMRAYNYIFENPEWSTSVLLLGVASFASLIPGVSILLQLLFLGYQFEIIGSLLKSQGKLYPKFDFGRFGDYLGRGIWPFLVTLVVSLILVPIIYVGLIVGVLLVVGISSAAGDQMGPVVGTLAGIVFGLLFLALVLFFSLFLVPMILRAGLAQEFGAAFQFAWITDFVNKMWVDMVVAGLFMMGTAIVLELVGLLALCVGLFFVIPLFVMAYAHLLYQLYAIYLSRGGQPVMAKVPVSMPPMAGPPGY